MVPIIIAIGVILFFWLIGLRIIPNSKIAIVEKWWSTKGSLNEQIIALNGEAGFQPQIIRGGVHFLSPLMFKVHICPLVTVPQGEIAYVFARDGKPLQPIQTLGKVIPESNNFQDAKAFLLNGGQKGPQRGIIREGTYAFNLAQFIILTRDRIYYLPMGTRAEESTINKMAELLKERDGFRPLVIKGSDDKAGIVTVHDGLSLNREDIIAPAVGDDPSNPETYHSNFQDPEKFLKAGGFRGRQYQVLVEGTYFINRFFATVELIDKSIIDVGYVGVVVSYIGEKGVDSTGDDYKHGELVDKGFRGVWGAPLMPGKYAFNTYAGKIIRVPTTNIILKWISNQTGSHNFDENLTEVSLITKDAFEPSLPLSVVMYITILSILWFGGNFIHIGTMKVGELTGFLSYVLQILNSLMMISNVFLMLSRSTTSILRVFEVLDEKPEITDSGDPALVISKGDIVFDNVSFKYNAKAKENVLSDVSLHMSAGQMIGVLGGTGAAKTSLVQLIPRLYEVSEGSVKIDGHDVREYSLHHLRDSVGMVLQNNTLFSGTIRENLLWGNENATQEELDWACHIACADEFLGRLPNGYETMLGQGGVNVSGGQKQRLCIARALLGRPKILILDDSTSAVDTATERKIRERLAESLPDTTRILITQRLASVEKADQIVLLDDGKITAVGSHSELLATNEVYREIWQFQQKGEIA